MITSYSQTVRVADTDLNVGRTHEVSYDWDTPSLANKQPSDQAGYVGY